MTHDFNDGEDDYEGDDQHRPLTWDDVTAPEEGPHPIRERFVTVLRKIYPDRKTGDLKLAQGSISYLQQADSFPELRDIILHDLRYPKPQSSKTETYGWVPSMFEQSERVFPDGKTRMGDWRRGAAEHDEICCWYGDVDNDIETLPICTVDLVAERLFALLGRHVSFFTYTSFRNTAAKPKFRIVFDIDRYTSRAEMLRIFHVVNAEVFGGQGDASIYDPGDYLYAPPHQTMTTQQDGEPLPVDDLLARECALREARPDLYRAYLDARPTRVREARQRSPEEQAAYAAQMGDMSIRDGFCGVGDRDFFNPVWAEMYRDAIKGAHYTTFRSVVAKTWFASSGSLTRGEMNEIMQQLDDCGNGYMQANYPDYREKWDELLDSFLAKLPIPDAFEPLLEREESGLVIKYLQGNCGEGKTYDRLTDMAKNRRRYVYVVDKIENIERRRTEFYKAAGIRVGYQFAIFEAHSRTDKANTLRVGAQLREIRGDIHALRAGKPVIVFVTQEGAAQADWTGWEDFSIVYDEVPEVFNLFEIDAGRHATLLKSRVCNIGVDGNCYEVGLTEAGREAIKHGNHVDNYEAVHLGLLIMLSKPGNRVWVKQPGWDDAEEKRMQFFSLLSPLNLRPFENVYMLGDSLMSSTLSKAWEKKWSVKFEPVEFQRRVRRVPTDKRVKIHYFSQHRDASFTRFREADLPLTQLGWFFRDEMKGPNQSVIPILWTSNERTRATLQDGSLLSQDWQPPKSHGRNDLQDYHRVAWLAAMKPSKFEAAAIREMCGMSAAELIEWREFNTMYQFALRCDLRDYESSSEIDLYVFSQRQAEYLKGRVGGQLIHHPDVVVDRPSAKQYGEKPMTPAEKMKASRLRAMMEKEGVTDAARLKIGPTLTPGDIELANRSFAHKMRRDEAKK